jgi:Ornithine cyclodeaminase/mu-crystallin family
MRTLHQVFVYDTNADRAVAFASRLGEELSLPIVPVHDLGLAIARADIVLAATWSTTPFILPGMLRSGTHVTTLGADKPGKAEVSADVIRSSLFVCDDRQLAVEMGALRSVQLGTATTAAELGKVLAGTHPGRTSDEQITIYGGVGLAFQDAVAGWQVYEHAVKVDAGHTRLSTGSLSRTSSARARSSSRRPNENPIFLHGAGAAHVVPARSNHTVAGLERGILYIVRSPEQRTLQACLSAAGEVISSGARVLIELMQYCVESRTRTSLRDRHSWLPRSGRGDFR